MVAVASVAAWGEGRGKERGVPLDMYRWRRGGMGMSRT